MTQTNQIYKYTFSYFIATTKKFPWKPGVVKSKTVQ